MSDAVSQSYGVPYVAQHAAERWDARTSEDSVSPETAWRTSPRSRRAARHLGVDEARYHAAEDVVLIRTMYVIPTVYAVGREHDAELYAIVREEFPHAATDGGEPR